MAVDWVDNVPDCAINEAEDVVPDGCYVAGSAFVDAMSEASFDAEGEADQTAVAVVAFAAEVVAAGEVVVGKIVPPDASHGLERSDLPLGGERFGPCGQMSGAAAAGDEGDEGNDEVGEGTEREKQNEEAEEQRVVMVVVLVVAGSHVSRDALM